MNEIKEYTETLFENIRHIDDRGNEYWFAREYQLVPKPNTHVFYKFEYIIYEYNY